MRGGTVRMGTKPKTTTTMTGRWKNKGQPRRAGKAEHHVRIFHPYSTCPLLTSLLWTFLSSRSMLFAKNANELAKDILSLLPEFLEDTMNMVLTQSFVTHSVLVHSQCKNILLAVSVIKGSSYEAECS